MKKMEGREWFLQWWNTIWAPPPVLAAKSLAACHVTLLQNPFRVKLGLGRGTGGSPSS